MTATTDQPAGPRRARTRSARARILVSFVVLLAFAALLSTILLRQVLLARAGERVDDALTQEVLELQRLARDGRNPTTGRPFGDDVRGMFDVFLSRNVPARDEDFFTYVDGRPHRTTAGPAIGPALRAQLTARVARTRAQDGVRGDLAQGEQRLRFLAVPVQGDGGRRGVFAVVIDVESERRDVEEAVQVAAAVSLLALGLATVLGFLIAGRILAPLREVTSTAAAISAEADLTRRIPADGDDEIAELARTFNHMLDRLETAFASQRAFLSDAGHELRTPITIVRGHLELLGDDPQERAETMALVSDELDRMARLVEDLLTLAKSERADFLHLEPLDLDVLTDELLAKARSLGDRDWQLDALGAGRLTADRQRLTQAVINLAHNAVQHTDPGTTIAIGSALRGRWAELWVRDEGPGIPPDARQRIFDRFARLPGSRRLDGSGLGLAITRAIAEAHGGRVEVDLPPGATFTITIPTEPEEQPA